MRLPAPAFVAQPQIHAVGGHYRNGILLAPVTARIIRDHAVEGRSSLAAAALLPDRLARR
jgi:glycine/D-amino acid oxidase-like deaminating enzyme